MTGHQNQRKRIFEFRNFFQRKSEKKKFMAKIFLFQSLKIPNWQDPNSCNFFSFQKIQYSVQML